MMQKCRVFRVCPYARRILQSSAKGHLVDALALRGDEGRSTLRKATGRCEQPLIRRFPNGETRPYWVMAC